jgi:hypothetical protein
MVRLHPAATAGEARLGQQQSGGQGHTAWGGAIVLDVDAKKLNPAPMPNGVDWSAERM